MKAICVHLLSAVLGLGLLLSASYACAQMGGGQGMGSGMAQGMNGKHMPTYDSSAVTTIKGTIEEVQQSAMPSGQGHMGMMHHMGTHLTLKTDSGTYIVLAGPSSFVKDKGFEFAQGDRIEVTGSRVKYDNADAVIAREIKKGDKVLTLRDEKGVPEWSKGRQR